VDHRSIVVFGIGVRGDLIRGGAAAVAARCYARRGWNGVDVASADFAFAAAMARSVNSRESFRMVAVVVT